MDVDGDAAEAWSWELVAVVVLASETKDVKDGTTDADAVLVIVGLVDVPMNVNADRVVADRTAAAKNTATIVHTPRKLILLLLL